MLSTGSQISLSSEFAGKDGNIAIYDLQGHLMLGNVRVQNGQAMLPAGKMIPRGVFIARPEK